MSHDMTKLREVFERAIEQAEGGKGAERHAGKDEAFEEQQIVKFGIWMENIGFQVGQACKKALEALRLPPDRRVKELLGAMNYLAAGVIVTEKLHPDDVDIELVREDLPQAVMVYEAEEVAKETAETDYRDPNSLSLDDVRQILRDQKEARERYLAEIPALPDGQICWAMLEDAQSDGGQVHHCRVQVQGQFPRAPSHEGDHHDTKTGRRWPQKPVDHQEQPPAQE